MNPYIPGLLKHMLALLFSKNLPHFRSIQTCFVYTGLTSLKPSAMFLYALQSSTASSNTQNEEYYSRAGGTFSNMFLIQSYRMASEGSI